MAKNELGWLVPDDWDGENYAFFTMCVPDSVMWKATVKGAVYLLGRAYSYDSDSGDINEAKRIGMEVFDSMANCNALIDAINQLSLSISFGSCSTAVGSDTDTDDGQEHGPLPDPVNDVPYSEPSAIVDRKCKAANYIHGNTFELVEKFRQARIVEYAFAGIAFALPLVAAIVLGVALGPFGVLVGAVVGSTLGMATDLIKASFSLPFLRIALLADEPAAICALFEATSASQARTDYFQVLSDNGASSAELSFVGKLLPNNVLNLLFFAWGDSESAIDATPIISDCTGCTQVLEQWLFETGLEGWTYVDESTPPSSASMAWHAFSESMRDTHNLKIIPFSNAVVRDTSPAISHVNTGEIKITVNYGAPTDDVNSAIEVGAKFAGSPDEVHLIDVTTGGQLQYTFTTLDEIIAVTVFTGRSQGASPDTEYTFWMKIEDVTLTGP